jgi:hypothetical protein
MVAGADERKMKRLLVARGQNEPDVGAAVRAVGCARFAAVGTRDRLDDRES